jgi:hypothetical protein
VRLERRIEALEAQARPDVAEPEPEPVSIEDLAAAIANAQEIEKPTPRQRSLATLGEALEAIGEQANAAIGLDPDLEAGNA